MNAERLREVIYQLLEVEARYNIQAKLIQARDFLQQLVQNPQQPQFQTQLSTSLEQMRGAVKQAVASRMG